MKFLIALTYQKKKKIYCIRKKKGKNLSFHVLNVDMNKAYDRVDWNFLHAVQLTMNFSPSLINLIQECVTTVNYTLLIKGSPTQCFKHSRDHRQGDPLSPYLFLMCAMSSQLLLCKLNFKRALKELNQGIKATLSLIYFS